MVVKTSSSGHRSFRGFTFERSTTSDRFARPSLPMRGIDQVLRMPRSSSYVASRSQLEMKISASARLSTTHTKGGSSEHEQAAQRQGRLADQDVLPGTLGGRIHGEGVLQ
eukprot:CAMPEP_0176175750 /NCGR_PEP_ID=MMETSP0120_2-20121206/90033_1 /TAXON_ID=160619 /ORGANISM="Kryptoperidinium foliaceum, Strain CCMP 1326" /LENGTH=109 /DNA_ID=CAMNT_0017513799 /DNA_START=118 /DNA_END=448 /DNA_ORIENTATION=+